MIDGQDLIIPFTERQHRGYRECRRDHQLATRDRSLAALQLTDWSNCINDGCTRKADRTTTSRVVVRNQPTRPFPEAVTAANE